MNIIILYGGPYSDAGKLCDIIQEQIEYKHIDIGKTIKNEINSLSELGIILKDYFDKGELIPDSIQNNLIDKIINENQNSKGIIFRNYPNSIPNINDFLNTVLEKKLTLTNVINIHISKEEILKRAKNIYKKQGDKILDESEFINSETNRFSYYQANNTKIIKHIKSTIDITTINGKGSIHEVLMRIKVSL